MPSSRFDMDRQALMSDDEDDPGLTDQARVNGGIGGLMHTLRCGETVLSLCDEMDYACPDALVINLCQPVARTTDIFLKRGYRCYGLGRSPLRGQSGLDGLVRRMGRKTDSVKAEIAGLPGFAFLLSLTDVKDGRDLLPQLKERAENGELGRLTRRWLDRWDMIPVGDVTDHAELLPAQEDFMPEEHPMFGETVEQRKERILKMNTVGQEGASSQKGAMAQVELLSKAQPIRPMLLAVSLLRGDDLDMPAVVRRNRREIVSLPSSAIIESRLTLIGGEEQPHSFHLNDELIDVMTAIADASSLAAQAAFGDRSALREYAECDPALEGLDRLYCTDVIDAMVRMHGDVLPRFGEDIL